MPTAAVLETLAAARSIVVFDLEFTAWEGSQQRGWSGPGEHREIVQIGAVRVGLDGFAECGQFERVVRPRINPRLSEYFVTLTGITQRRVDAEGLLFAEALAAFTAFAETADAIVSNGDDHAVLLENIRLSGGGLALPDRPFLNVSRFLAHGAGVNGHITSADLSGHFAAVEQARSHDALADARTVAAALRATLAG